MPNRNDVAARAGVSPAVVSYVLNNSNYVSEKKRKAVLKAVEELDYHPNYAARSLKVNETRQLLLVSDDIRNEIFSDIAYYIEEQAFQHGYFLSTTSCSRKKAIDFEKVFYSRQYDAILLANNVYSLQEINRIAQKGVPVVLYQTRYYEDLDPAVSIVGADLKAGMGQLVDYLVDKGHRIIGYVGDPNTPTTPGEKGEFGEGFRINGYLEAMERHGLEIPNHYLYATFLKSEADWPAHGRGILHLSENELIEQKVERVANDILIHINFPQRATAYIVNSDRLAVMLMLRLQELGLRIPEDVAITGFGDSFSAKICRPQLTTMQIPTQQIAASAMEAMLAKCAGNQPENVLYPLRLIQRDSA